MNRLLFPSLLVVGLAGSSIYLSVLDLMMMIALSSGSARLVVDGLLPFEALLMVPSLAILSAAGSLYVAFELPGIDGRQRRPSS
jgi:hypothetical protein